MTLRRAALAVAGGLALYAGHPPWDLGWLAPFALVPLLLLARDPGLRSWRATLGWGLLAGVVAFGPLLVWIGRFGVVPWVLLAAIQGVFVAAWFMLVVWWGDRGGRPAFAALAWVGIEAFRSAWPMGGFPWGVLGYTQHDGGLFLPVARSLGVLGVSFALAAVAAAVEEAGVRLVRGWRQGGRGGVEETFTAARVPLAAVLVILVAVVLLGGDPPPERDRTIDAVAVQGNDEELPPLVDRGALGRITRLVDRMVETTQQIEGPPPDLVVWPENSLDADTRRHEGLRERVDEALTVVDGGALVAGTILDGPRPGTFVNAMVQYDSDGDIAKIAEKRKLVPFGEYVPGRRWLAWYPTLRHIPSDGVPGSEPVVFDIGGVTVAPLTCYESLFPGLLHDQIDAGAEVVVVSTNNASFGRTAATWQHLAFSQLRAVETGRWVLHAGISGVSAVVDPRGGTSHETEVFTQTIVRAELPLVQGRTLATRLGDWPGRLAALAALGMLLAARALDWPRRSRHLAA